MLSTRGTRWHLSTTYAAQGYQGYDDAASCGHRSVAEAGRGGRGAHTHTLWWRLLSSGGPGNQIE
ncbi:hypothetical protein T492DRAFT_985213 [Pavlovales sp. CCMP2436]|nr:hypothetical protein T492DRAFT_985213 [Pavlovales sp. CCMP2436]